MANMQQEKVIMSTLDENERIHNFKEVNCGYSKEDALIEADRCLQCPTKPCVSSCPVNIDIPGFIKHLKNDEMKEAYKLILEENHFPAICGRVCPQESQCESKCVRGIKGEAVAIGRLERFVADYYSEHYQREVKEVVRNNKKVAVVGSGPAGLSCAMDLVQYGYDVTVFEALHKAGGVLQYGIPEFRLPKSIVENEIDVLEKQGVKFIYNAFIGRTITIQDLIDDQFEAIFIGSGAGVPRFMHIKNEAAIGVFSANEYLTRVNLMKSYDPQYHTPVIDSKKVAVIGGGNVAMDAARCAKRLGNDVTIVYRRSLSEMPARQEEIHHAMEEQVKFLPLFNPEEILVDDSNRVTGLKLQKMKLTEPDESNRRGVVAMEGEYDIVEFDTVIMAIGTSLNPLITSSIEDLKLSSKGGIIVNEDGQSSVDYVFAGGDAVSGAATVILAMSSGKKAAKGIHEFLEK